MTTAQVLTAQGIDVQTSTPHTTYREVAKIPGSSFDANTTYLIIANAVGNHASSSEELRLRLLHGSTPFTDGSLASELLTTTQHASFGWMFKFTQGSTPEDIILQVASSSSVQGAVDFGRILAFRLSDLGSDGTQYHWNEVTNDYTTTSSFVSQASVTFTPGGSDDWLIIGQGVVSGVNTATSHGVRLNDSVAGALVTIDVEGEDATNDIKGYLLMAVVTPSNASHTFSVQFNHETDAHTVLSSRIFALNLSVFAQHAFSRAAGTENMANSSWTTTRTLSVTPTTTGNWVIWGYLTNDVNSSSNNAAHIRLQVNPDGSGLVSDPNYGDDAPGNDGWDNLDLMPFNIFTVRQLTSGGSRAINLDHNQVTVTNQQIALERTLVAFSVQLAGGTDYVINASAGALSVDSDEATIVPGEFTVQGTAAQLSVETDEATVIPGEFTVQGAAAQLSVETDTATVVPGAVTVLAVAAALAVESDAATVVPGPCILLANTVELTLETDQATVILGTILISASEAELSLIRDAAVIVTGPVTVETTSVVLTLEHDSATVEAVTTITATSAALVIESDLAVVQGGAVVIVATSAVLEMVCVRALVGANLFDELVQIVLVDDAVRSVVSDDVFTISV